jgi:hypothetical protein
MLKLKRLLINHFTNLNFFVKNNQCIEFSVYSIPKHTNLISSTWTGPLKVIFLSANSTLLKQCFNHALLYLTQTSIANLWKKIRTTKIYYLFIGRIYLRLCPRAFILGKQSLMHDSQQWNQCVLCTIKLLPQARINSSSTRIVVLVLAEYSWKILNIHASA